MQLAFSLYEGTPKRASARGESIETFHHQPRRAREHRRVTNLLEEEKGDEPGNDRVSRGHSARKEIRVLLQKLAAAEHVREPFRRTRKRASNDGSIPNTRSWAKEANSMLRTN